MTSTVKDIKFNKYHLLITLFNLGIKQINNIQVPNDKIARIPKSCAGVIDS